MRILIDTSALVAALVAAHPAHERCRRHWARARLRQFESLLAAHGLAESYSTLTRLPLSPRITPLAALTLLRDNVTPCARIVALTPEDYWIVLKEQAELGHGGGAIYDALLAHAARKARAGKVLTLNPLHFRRVAPDLAPRVVEPYPPPTVPPAAAVPRAPSPGAAPGGPSTTRTATPPG